MIVEALTTLTLIIDTAITWVQILAGAAAFVACVVLFAIGPLVALPVKHAARRATGPSWRRGRIRARILTRQRVRTPQARTARRVPVWAHTQPLDYEEAA